MIFLLLKTSFSGLVVQRHSAAEPQPNWRTAPPRVVSGQHSAVSSGFEPPDERGEHTLDLGGSLGKLLKTLAIEQPELVGKEQFVFELAC